ncbi:Intradiol ring-cleavage dioxygenase [Podospora conica]|nr:Intradiol ring-cleavage dioxygenase [Schizothecium conicum]
MHLTTLVVGALAALCVSAHPGHDLSAELAEREAALSQYEYRDLSHCADKIRERGLEARSVARRNALVQQLQKRANLKARSLEDLLKTSHHSKEQYTLATPADVLFASNNSCVLSPEVTEGPYYVAGEYIRKNIVEKQEGVPLTLDLQVLDVATCEPLKNVYLEIWHCNTTGVYSGVSAAGNGNADPANVNTTYLRGIQPTSSDGVALFETLFPGHYTGRATHIHVMVHANATAAANGTLMGTTAAHVGQVYFDQDLISRVTALPAYAANTQVLTTNAKDFLLAQGAAVGDPFVHYVQLGEKIEEGLLGWIAFGVNATMARKVQAGATLYETGGVGSPGGGFGPGFGGGAPPPGMRPAAGELE